MIYDNGNETQALLTVKLETDTDLAKVTNNLPTDVEPVSSR